MTRECVFMKAKFVCGILYLIMAAGAIAQPVLTISATSLDFGDVEMGGNGSFGQQLILENSGDASLTIDSIPQIPDFASGFFMFPNEQACWNLPIVLPAGGMCTYSVSYNPTSIGPSSFEVTFFSDAPSSPDSVSLTGNGLPGIPLSVSTEFSFGSVEAGKTGNVWVYVNNYSATPTTIFEITTPVGDFSLDEANSTCSVLSFPWVLASQGTCYLRYVFTSTENLYKQQDITITSDAPSSPDVFSIFANKSPMLVGADVEYESLNFGNVGLGETKAAEVRLINSGPSVLDITSFSAPNGPEFAQLFPGEAGDCGAPPFTLNVGDECALHSSFSPTVKGQLYDSISVMHSGGEYTYLSLSGAGAAPYELSIEPSLLDFGDVTVGQDAFSTILSFAVTNIGANPITLSEASIFPDFGVDPSLQVQPGETACQFPWPVQLQPGESCNFGAYYQPSTVGPTAFDVELVSDAPSSPDIVTITGEGIPGESLSLSDPFLYFGNLKPGTVFYNFITVSNNSLAPTSISDITAATGGFRFESQSTCNVASFPLVLPAMSSCTLSYSFSPTAYEMDLQNIIVTSDAPSSPDNFQLAGNITPMIAEADPIDANISSTGTLEFGFVAVGGTKEIQGIRLINSETQTIHISSMDLPAGAFQQQFPGGPGDCPVAPFTLTAGDECALYFSFTPTASQAYLQYLSIVHDGIVGYNNVAITGTAIPVGITYTPSEIDFGYVIVGQTSESQPVRFTGSAGITLTALDSPIGDFSIVSHDCPSGFPVPVPITLPFNVDCTGNVAFTPSVEAVVSQDIVAVSDAPTSPDGYTLVGTGILPPAITYTPDIVDFGSVPVGQTSETKAVRFTGSTGLVFNILDDPAGDFSVISHDCPASFPLPIPTTLPFNVDCLLNIAFTPSAVGAISQNVEAVTSASTSPDGFSLRGMGVAGVPGAPAIIAVEPSDGEIQVRFSVNGDGGSPITAYRATCGSVSTEGAGSPITVTGLDNNVEYICSVVAMNSVGSSASSANVPGTPGEIVQGLNIILIKAAIDGK
jgi:hypothetical protein